MKLPSPFTLTVRASTDYVKVFPEQLPESERLAGLVRYPRMSGLCWPLNVPVRENRALPRRLLPGKLRDRSGIVYGRTFFGDVRLFE